jgi:hypothetical protein
MNQTSIRTIIGDVTIAESPIGPLGQLVWKASIPAYAGLAAQDVDLLPVGEDKATSLEQACAMIRAAIPDVAIVDAARLRHLAQNATINRAQVRLRLPYATARKHIAPTGRFPRILRAYGGKTYVKVR